MRKKKRNTQVKMENRNTRVKMDKNNDLSIVYNQNIDIQIMILNYLCFLITL